MAEQGKSRFLTLFGMTGFIGSDRFFVAVYQLQVLKKHLSFRAARSEAEESAVYDYFAQKPIPHHKLPGSK